MYSGASGVGDERLNLSPFIRSQLFLWSKYCLTRRYWLTKHSLRLFSSHFLAVRFHSFGITFVCLLKSNSDTLKQELFLQFTSPLHVSLSVAITFWYFFTTFLFSLHFTASYLFSARQINVIYNNFFKSGNCRFISPILKDFSNILKGFESTFLVLGKFFIWYVVVWC